MPDELSTEDRALIAAFPADRIQRIPLGTTAAEFVMTWNEQTQQITTGRTIGEHRAIMKRQMFAGSAAAKNRAAKAGGATSTEERRGAADVRREKVAELRAAGRTLNDIAAAVGVSRTTVKGDLKRMRQDA